MELNDQAKSILAAVLGVKVEEITKIAETEEAEQQFKDMNKAKLDKLRDESHKRGAGMVKKAFKSAIKSNFDLDIDLDLEADDIATKLSEHISERGAENISEESIKASPVYKSLQSDLTRAQQDQNKIVEKKVKELVKEEKEKFDKELKQAKKSSQLSKVETEFVKWAEKEGVILNSDPEKRDKQIRKYVKDLTESLDLDEDEEGRPLLSKDGTPLTNKDGHNASFSDVFRDNDYLFVFKTVQERQSSNLNPNGGGNNQQKKFEHYRGEVPKTQAEFDALQLKYVNKEKDAPSRDAFKEVQAAFAEQQKN